MKASDGNPHKERSMSGELRYPRFPVRTGRLQLVTSLSLWLDIRLLTHNEYDFALSVTAL